MKIVRLLESVWRHAVVYPALRLRYHNAPVDLPVDLGAVRRLLLLRTDRLGDMVVTSSLVRRIREVAPSIVLGMVVSQKNIAAARLVDGIDHLHVIGRDARSTVRAVREARGVGYDVVLNLVFNRTTLGGLLSNVIAPRGIKIGQGDEKYRFFFNAMVRPERGVYHMARILHSIGVQAFGGSFASEEQPYYLHDDPDAVRKVEAALRAWPAKPVLVNLSAGEPLRAPNELQMIGLVRGLLAKVPNPILVSSAPDQQAMRTAVLHEVDDPRVQPYPAAGTASFAELVALVRRCRFLVSPDTSLVHVAGATKTPLVALYATAYSHTEWSAINTLAVEVLNEGDRPMSAMPVERMLEGVDKLLRRIGE